MTWYDDVTLYRKQKPNIALQQRVFSHARSMGGNLTVCVGFLSRAASASVFLILITKGTEELSYQVSHGFPCICWNFRYKKIFNPHLWALSIVQIHPNTKKAVNRKIMESPWSENLSADRERAIEELVRGQEFTKQLRTLLGKPKGDDHETFSAGDLITRILRSFNESISILTCSQSDEVSQIPADKDGQKSEDSGESRKCSGLKDRRGCYKRRYIVREIYCRLSLYVIAVGMINWCSI